MVCNQRKILKHFQRIFFFLLSENNLETKLFLKSKFVKLDLGFYFVFLYWFFLALIKLIEG
jgi:hypothetical protein